MFPSINIFRVTFAMLRSLTLDSVQNISSYDLSTFLRANPNVVEIFLRRMVIDETSLPFMTRMTKIHFMLMQNFDAFDIDSLAVVPVLNDLKVTGLDNISRERLIQFSRLIELVNLEIGILNVEPLASNIYSDILDSISTLTNLNCLNFISNVEIDHTILESRPFIGLFFQKQTNVLLTFKDRHSEYVFTPSNIYKNDLLLITRQQFFCK